jgi:pimeloyl-ACP methyl ester carboxylesterase
MNVALWIVQALLAAVFAAHGWLLVSPPPELLPLMNEQLGVGFRLFLGVAEIAGGIGLLLPAMSRRMPWLTPVAAGCLAFVVASATALHLSRGETSSAVTTGTLCALATFVAYARWRMRPIARGSGSRFVARAHRPHMKAAAWIAAVALSTAATTQAQAQEPTTGYAPVNGLDMYYEIHGSGSGEPLVLLHGSFMTIPSNWTGWIEELSKSRRVIALEMQGHGRTVDIDRDFSYEALADDIAGLLDFLQVPRADLLGYSMGGGVAMQVAIRHGERVRRVVSVSAVFRHDGWVQEALDAFPQMTADVFAGSPIEAEYERLSPTPHEFPNFIRRVIAMDLQSYDFGVDRLGATEAPFLFVHGDADGVRLDHIAEMFRLKGGEIFGDMRARSESRLAVLPNTTHVTLMQKAGVIIPMVNEFLDAASQEE